MYYFFSFAKNDNKSSKAISKRMPAIEVKRQVVWRLLFFLYFVVTIYRISTNQIYSDLNTSSPTLSVLDEYTSVEEKQILSPACRPFRYNQTKNGEISHSDYFDEFWKDKSVPKPTKIKFLHMRKAGGTTIHKYLKDVVESKKTSFLEYDVCEGAKKCLELNFMDDGYHRYYNDERNSTLYGESIPWDSSGKTFYVTHIREPVARALSHYKYEKRFKCQTSLSHRFKSCQNPLRYVKTFRNI